MTEKNTFEKMKKEVGNIIEFFSIETGGTELGIPDVYYRGKEFNGWIELKQVKEKINTDMDKFSLDVPYRSGQLNWLNGEYNRGLKVFLLMEFNDVYHLIKGPFKLTYNGFEIVQSIIWYGTRFTSNKFINCLKGIYYGQ